MPTHEKKWPAPQVKSAPLGRAAPRFHASARGSRPSFGASNRCGWCVDYGPGRSGPQTFLAYLASLQRIIDCSDRLATVTLHIQARNDPDLFGHTA